MTHGGAKASQVEPTSRKGDKALSITAVKPEGVKESKHATFVMPHDLYDEAQEIAKERDLTFSQVVRRALRDFLSSDSRMPV